MVTKAYPSAIKQIDEMNNVIALTDRVKKRREEYMAATPRLCAERSRLVTESWKETVGESIHIRRAKLYKKVIEGISVIIREGELIVGSQTKYVRGAGPYVDWRPDVVFERLEAPRLTLQGVKKAEVSEAEKASLLEDARYWKGKTAADNIYNAWHEVFGDKIVDLEEAQVIKGVVLHPHVSRIADYGKVIDKGINSVIAEAREGLQKLLSGDFSGRHDIDKVHFLQAVIIVCEGIIHFAHRHAELASELAGSEGDVVRKKELEKIADICQWVPANPARSFYEAVQSFWFTHLGINMESSFCLDAPGRMDQYLYPLYKSGLEEGLLTRQEADELLGCLWVKLSEMEVVQGKVGGETLQSSTFQDVTIGGVTRDGRDASNELSYLLLEVTRQLKTIQPPLYLRCHRGTPEELWIKAAEVNADRGDGTPAFLNDEPILLNFVAKNIPIQEARDWGAGGCVIPHLSHASFGDKPYNINLAKVFEITLNNGVDPRNGKQVGLATGDSRDFSSFNELYDAFKKQADYFMGLLGKAHRLLYQERSHYYSLPFFSALTDDCIAKGLDVGEGGVRYPQLYYGIHDRGHQNIADSLTAIKRLVFEEEKISMAELLDALAVNFEGKEKLRQMLLAAPKYGNDDDYADDIFNDLSLWTQRRAAQEKNIFGLNHRIPRGGATKHYYFGQVVGALPDGRKAWVPLADASLSPMRGVDVKGPTAVINSASKVNHTEVATSSLFNMKFTRSILQSREGLQKFIALIKTYFDRGGYHIQFNLMGQETLLEAKKHPEQYRDLLVRVAGYSAYFVDLAPEIQDEIIARSEHTL